MSAWTASNFVICCSNADSLVGAPCRLHEEHGLASLERLLVQMRRLAGNSKPPQGIKGPLSAQPVRQQPTCVRQRAVAHHESALLVAEARLPQFVRSSFGRLAQGEDCDNHVGVDMDLRRAPERACQRWSEKVSGATLVDAAADANLIYHHVERVLRSATTAGWVHAEASSGTLAGGPGECPGGPKWDGVTTAPLPKTWHGHIRWRLAVPIVGLGLLFGIIGSTAMTHRAELAQSVEAGREMVAGTGAWLSTAVAQAFTMQCTHARER